MRLDCSVFTAKPSSRALPASLREAPSFPKPLPVQTPILFPGHPTAGWNAAGPRATEGGTKAQAAHSCFQRHHTTSL